MNINFQPNTLYEMDNLVVLRGMNSETVDLIATDPPVDLQAARQWTRDYQMELVRETPHQQRLIF